MEARTCPYATEFASYAELGFPHLAGTRPWMLAHGFSRVTFIPVALPGPLFFFDLHQLLYAPDMPGIAEWRRQKDLHDLPDDLFAEQVRPQAQDVAMIVLARRWAVTSS